MPGNDAGRGHRHDESGSVTAEAAIVLPLMAVFVLALVWMISLGITEVRAVDAARDAAREIARGGDDAAAVAAARDTVPESSTVRVDHGTEDVAVVVTVRQQPPVGCCSRSRTSMCTPRPRSGPKQMGRGEAAVRQR